MNEKSEPNGAKYHYKYVQFTVTSEKKRRIQRFASGENFKTTSDFMRRVVFDYIRKQEHPELFVLPDRNSVSPLLVEKLSKNIREVLRNQEVILQREDKWDEMGYMIASLHRMAETASLAKERDAVICVFICYS